MRYAISVVAASSILTFALSDIAIAEQCFDSKAVTLERNEAKLGVAAAQVRLGSMYATGCGVPQNYTEALSWFRKAAEQGNADAEDYLGHMYADGDGVPQDYAEAVIWYRKAVDQGDAQAQSDLGYMYERGRGVPKDYKEAVVWYRKAAEQGNASAQNNLGAVYEAGWGVPQSDTEAAAWYRKAAEHQGNGEAVAQAKRSLGNMFQEGQGVPLDSTQAATQAATSYRKAAEKGDATAQYSLGTFYNRGKGVPQDYTQAVVWYRKAAEQGLYDAQLALGGMYQFGLGVPKDYTEAVAWYRKAAAQGNFIAQQRLDDLLEDMGESRVASPAPDPSKDGSEVILRRQGGTFLIPVSINNAISLNFIIDSGAADVSIPYDVAITLMRTGTITSSDFLGSQTYTLADGSHVPSEMFKIRTLKVGDREIHDVTGSVGKIEGSLLLGQSFLTRFKSWSIDNERGVLVLK